MQIFVVLFFFFQTRTFMRWCCTLSSIHQLTPHISAIIHHTVVPSSPHCPAPSSSRNCMMDVTGPPEFLYVCVDYINMKVWLTEASCQLVREEGVVLHYYCGFSTKPLGRTEGEEKEMWWHKGGGGGWRQRRRPLEIKGWTVMGQRKEEGGRDGGGVDGKRDDDEIIEWWRWGIREELSCEVLSVIANFICDWICCSCGKQTKCAAVIYSNKLLKRLFKVVSYWYQHEAFRYLHSEETTLLNVSNNTGTN